MNFELLLTFFVALLGVIALMGRFFKKINLPPVLIENARSFFPVLLLVLLLRSFVIEPFRIPSGSLKPTLLIGDFVVVNKFSYGLRLPVLHTLVAVLGDPKRGDIAVFRAPPEPQVDYIKRIIGVPGDHLSYIDKILYINGKPMPQVLEGYRVENDSEALLLGDTEPMALKEEKLEGVSHLIYQRPRAIANNFYDVVVPAGYYFAMGDNRDESRDSRQWGFVPESNLVGKAFLVWFSWDGQNYRIRWNRIGKKII